MEAIRLERVLRGRVHVDDNTDERLAAREAVASARLNQFPRKL